VCADGNFLLPKPFKGAILAATAEKAVNLG